MTTMSSVMLPIIQVMHWQYFQRSNLFGTDIWLLNNMITVFVPLEARRRPVFLIKFKLYLRSRARPQNLVHHSTT